MRAFYISLVIIMILIIGWFSLYNHLTNFSQQLNTQLESIEGYINNNKWSDTESTLKSIKNNWKDSLQIYTLILDHEIIEQINLSLLRIEKFIKIQNKPLSLGEIATLKYLFDHIKEKESLSLYNIL